MLIKLVMHLHGVEKEVAGTFRAQRTGRRHKETRRSRTHAAAADWKVRSVCKKGISKQYKKIKHRCAAEITQHPAILADTYTDCEGTNAKMKIVTVNGRGIKAKVQLDEENDGGKTRHSGMDRTSPASRRQATEMGRNTTARL